MSDCESPRTIVAVSQEQTKHEKPSIFQRTLQFCSNALRPTFGVVFDVSTHYAQKLYHKVISTRDAEEHYQFLIRKACSYEQFAAAGFMLDREKGLDEWKYDETSNDYDYELVKDRLNTLKTIRKNGDVPAMIFNLRTSLSRNLGDMGNQKLYEFTNVGTKALIEDYIDEVTKQLNFICDVDIEGFGIPEKLEFFRNTQKAFGRTALLLSGGGTFGLLHAGVIKVLWEQKLLPKIISGSSAGSIVAAMVCTRTDKETHFLMDPTQINYNFFERENEKGKLFLKVSRFLKDGVVFDAEAFNDCMKANIGDITFAEAYNRTGRILNITVSSSTNFEMPRILNYLTAPNVLIRTAVVASSAVPFLFSSAPLLAKDANKNIVPWNPSGHQWIDGSVEGDLPMQRLSELFGVNHYCVSQVNPHIMPFLNTSQQKPTRLSRLVASIGSIISAEFQHRLRQIIEIGIHNSLIFKGHSILSQKYVGDITIVPHVAWRHFVKIITSPDIEMARDYERLGELACWPKIAILRNHGLIEQCLTQNIMRLRERMIVCPEQYMEKPLVRASVTKRVGSSHGEMIIESQNSLGQWSSESSIEPKDEDKKARLVRNHRSAGDIRSHFTMSAKQSPTYQANVGGDPLFFLDLTYEDSEEDL